MLNLLFNVLTYILSMLWMVIQLWKIVICLCFFGCHFQLHHFLWLSGVHPLLVEGDEMSVFALPCKKISFCGFRIGVHLVQKAVVLFPMLASRPNLSEQLSRTQGLFLFYFLLQPSWLPQHEWYASSGHRINCNYLIVQSSTSWSLIWQLSAFLSLLGI